MAGMIPRRRRRHQSPRHEFLERQVRVVGRTGDIRERFGKDEQYKYNYLPL